MFRGESANAVLRLNCSLIVALLMFVSASAQRVEHYNSPLYSPKAYEPGQSPSSTGLPPALKNVSIEQKLDEQVPLDATFTDEEGRQVKLGEYFGKDRPVVLALVYYSCPMLCTEILNGVTGAAKGIPNLTIGKDYDVVAISFDARENQKPGLAKNKKDGYIARYGREGAENGWHFLTGEQSEIDKVTKSVGFNYYYEAETDQFAHAGGVMVITPKGRISRYLYGVEYAPKDMKLALMESSQNKIGSLVDQLSLFCYHYNPATGTYGFKILMFIRIVGVVTMVGIVAMWLYFWRRNKRGAVATV